MAWPRRQWSEWCLGFGLDPQVADGARLAMRLTALSETRKLATIELRRAAVLEVRRRLGRPLPFDDAQFQAFLAGLRRTKGVRPSRKAALFEENLRAVMLLLDPEKAPDPKRRLRDRALLLTGFAGGFRRSELAGFDLRDLKLHGRGPGAVRGRLQDRPGAPRRGGRHPGRAELAALRRHRGLGPARRPRRHAAGPLFCRIDRGGHLTSGLDGRLQSVNSKTVARLVKRVIRRTGLAEGEFSGHSLRAGMMTAADRKGVPLEAAMQHGRWKDARTARAYRRHSSLWVGILRTSCSRMNSRSGRATGN